jgi:hypothetical protein
VAGGTAAETTTGRATANSSNTGTATITVTAANDAPTLGSASVVLTGGTEDVPLIISFANLATTAPVQVAISAASTTSSYSAVYTAAKAIDGITSAGNNGWFSSSNGSDTNPRLTLDVGSAQLVTRYRIYHENDAGCNLSPQNWTFEGTPPSM